MLTATTRLERRTTLTVATGAKLVVAAADTVLETRNWIHVESTG